MNILQSKALSIPEMYEGILGKSLNQVASNENIQVMDIWEEHVESGIIRTIIELSYPYIKEEKEKSLNATVIILCPEEEYHELGARMITDFYTLLGFDALFIGANTPEEEVFKAIEKIKPEIISISITNYFHLTKLKDFIIKLKEDIQTSKNFKIIVGGYALESCPSAKESINADFYAHTYKDLMAFKEENYDTRI
jgi:methanogenic corrinoid protein MtbC1